MNVQASYHGRHSSFATPSRTTSTRVQVLFGTGCGKTTLLRMVAGLLAPNAGKVLVGGVGVSARKRTTQDAETFEQKLKWLKDRNINARMQLELFENTMPPRMKHLDFVGERVCVDWRCADEDCAGHSMQVLDWEICELARKNGLDAAINKVQVMLDLESYGSAFFLGNFFMYPASFAIIGLWYPRRSNRLF